jgi:hypothetical protein
MSMNMSKKLGVMALAIAGLSFFVTGPVSADHHGMSATEKVLKHHLDSFAAGDLEAILSDYTEESFMITPDGTSKGIDELREFFAGLLQGLPPGSRFVVQKQTIEGEYAYIVWSAGSAKMMIPFGTDTFRIVKGKIVAQTFAGQIISKAQR